MNHGKNLLPDLSVNPGDDDDEDHVVDQEALNEAFQKAEADKFEASMGVAWVKERPIDKNKSYFDKESS